MDGVIYIYMDISLNMSHMSLEVCPIKTYPRTVSK